MPLVTGRRKSLTAGYSFLPVSVGNALDAVSGGAYLSNAGKILRL
jgi:hypothetical protein